MSEGTVYEVRIGFGVGDAARVVKRRVMAWLSQHGYAQIVETVVDGVEVEADDEARATLEAAGESSDGLPAAVFVDGESVAQALVAGLGAEFGPAVSARAELLSADAWMSAWTPEWRAFATRRFWVQPEGDGAEADPGLLPIVVRPGEAFGNGQHAATQAMIETLEALPLPVEPRGLLDVGTGTGILAVAAHKLGYGPIVATDLDAPILDEARANLALNDARAELLLTDQVPLGSFAVVVANILVPVLHALMPDFRRSLAPGGRLLLSGFIANDEPELERTARAQGLTVSARHECRGWSCLVLRRR